MENSQNLHLLYAPCEPLSLVGKCSLLDVEQIKWNSFYIFFYIF